MSKSKLSFREQLLAIRRDMDIVKSNNTAVKDFSPDTAIFNSSIPVQFCKNKACFTVPFDITWYDSIVVDFRIPFYSKINESLFIFLFDMLVLNIDLFNVKQSMFGNQDKKPHKSFTGDNFDVLLSYANQFSMPQKYSSYMFGIIQGELTVFDMPVAVGDFYFFPLIPTSMFIPKRFRIRSWDFIQV